MEALETSHRIKRSNRNVWSVKQRPWRKPGADISDYFNYGFDEESWRAYCDKQAKLQSFRRKKKVKFMDQARHAGYEKEESCHAHSSSSGQSISASRESNANIDVSGIQAGCRREEGVPCFRDGVNNTQVAAEMSCKEDSITTYHLPPKVNINSPFAFVPPPPFLFRSGSPPPGPVLGGGHCEGFDGSSTSLHQCYSVSGNKAMRTTKTDTAKAWECYIRQEKHDKDKDRSRERAHEKKRKRRRARGKQGSSSSHNSGEEQMKHMSSVERGDKHRRFDRDNGETRERDESEGWQKTPQSGSRKDDNDDEARDRRHKRKKVKKKAAKKRNKMISTDQERT